MNKRGIILIGTSVLGGITTNQLTSRLANIGGDPFVALMKNLNPSAAIVKMDTNTIQGFLTSSGQAQVKAMLAQAPQAIQSQLAGSFAHFLDTIKIAFSNSMDHVFVIGTIMMAVALVAIFFLPEIPLRKSKHPALDEVEL
ncbi:MAG: MFS transporter, partial [Dehalococcoidales bacterium]|nr:MFS transporter [Dehalococcoidales bacterium]